MEDLDDDAGAVEHLAPVARSRLRIWLGESSWSTMTNSGFGAASGSGSASGASGARPRSARAPWTLGRAPSSRPRRCRRSAPPVPPACRCRAATRRRCPRAAATPCPPPRSPASSPGGPAPRGWRRARRRRPRASGCRPGRRAGWGAWSPWSRSSTDRAAALGPRLRAPSQPAAPLRSRDSAYAARRPSAVFSFLRCTFGAPRQW